MRLVVVTLAAAVAGGAGAQHQAMSVAEALTPYDGPVVTDVDTSRVDGKVMTGYQGWFMAPGDGYEPGWVHWGGVGGDPPRATVDMWPDMTEYGPDERFPANFRYADGRPGELFSSTVRATVLRHFEWMRDYGIDGAWIQRFTSCISNQADWNYQRTTAVLNLCREGANRTGRAFGVMYDTDFNQRAIDAMKADWSRLIQEMELTATPAYIRHGGAPVISLWGYGFDHRQFDAAATREFFQWLKQPENGGCTIMLGLPNDWVDWTDERMELLAEYATIISPWNVGRYGSPEGAEAHAARYWPADLAYCQANDKLYYPVVFPGFSWTNLQNGNNPLNQIPRLGGRFAWRQIELVREYGMNLAYLAMFDEVDEGTAWFKVTNDPPQGRWATYEGYPSDYYLTIAGLAQRYLRGEQVSLPQVTPEPVTYRPTPQLEFYRRPSNFSAATIAGWRAAFGGVPIDLHEEPYSDWIADLYYTDALDLRLSSWADLLARPADSPILLFAAGNEGFGAPDALVPQIVGRAQEVLRAGGVVVVAGGGNYPLFYPNQGGEAAKFGFRLAMTQAPAGSTISFAAGAPAGLEPVNLQRGGRSRLMRAALYPAGTPYRALATITTPAGEVLGDALAAVRPGGDLGTGWVVYIAADLLASPQREQLLSYVLAAANQLVESGGG